MSVKGKALNKIISTSQALPDNFARHIYVNGWAGVDASGYGFSWDKPCLTMAYALSIATSGSVVHLAGRITEQITAPLALYDITIEGEVASTPRQSTNSGAQAGYSAYWMYETDNTVALLTIREQGWKFKNICFQAPASTADTAAAVLMIRAESATYPDPSHVMFENCYFAGGGNAIIDSGGVGFVTLLNNRFYGQLGHCVKNVAGAGIAAPLNWHIKGNRFLNFVNGIYAAFSHAVIEENVFSDGGTPNTTTVLNTAALGGGGNNFIINNFFQTATANFNTPDVVGNATDVWLNTCLDTAAAGTSGVYEIGQPA
jgi:hypothetical protein